MKIIEVTEKGVKAADDVLDQIRKIAPDIAIMEV